jgi:shikimate dehydrogenase
VIANRTPGKAIELAAVFAALGNIRGVGLDDLGGQSFDVIINATAASLEDTVPPLPAGVLRPGGWCYDLVYAKAPTAFVRWGRAHGASRSVDGLGMLVEQAAESFLIWRGVRPDTEPVLAALRSGSSPGQTLGKPSDPRP